jgi:pyruvate dehydrogenase E1 component alpha subunit
MPETVIAAFEVRRTRFLDPEGRATGALPRFAEDPKEVVRVYRAMHRARRFDARAIALQRAGQIGTYASSLGEEAVGVGVASAMREEDVFLPSFREQSAMLWRGVSPVELLLYWGGDERGSDFAVPRADFPICVPVASHALHAAGAALAFKLRREPRVAVCVLGDGGTSKGDFAEALNFAGVFALPAVFVIANNQWAISVPRARQTAAATLAQKAIAAGIPGEQVDGNDVLAVRDALERALARAREGEGASVVEAVTYRLADHTTADDSRRYRSEAEVTAAWREEPIARLRAWLLASGAWSAADEEALGAELSAEIEAGVQAYLAVPPQPPTAIFDYLYASLPRDLAEARAALAADGAGGG